MTGLEEGLKKSVVNVTFGWFFDVYLLDNKMIFWIKQENGNTVRLEDNGWGHSIYSLILDLLLVVYLQEKSENQLVCY